MLRMIVSDLDGTLLTNHHTIHPDNVTALRGAIAAGVVFAVASGRTAASCARILSAHHIPHSYIIAVNGCEIVSPSGEVLERHHLANATAKEAMGIFRFSGLDACLYSEGSIVYTSRRMLLEQEGLPEETDLDRGLLIRGVHVRAGEAALLDELEKSPLKTFCVCRAGQERAFEAARLACGQIPGVELTSSWRDNFEVMPLSVNKGAAVASLARRLGIAREEVIAFGDYDNDIPMLKWAGTGYAMGNAAPHVKQIADAVVASNVDGGVAQGVREGMRGAWAR